MDGQAFTLILVALLIPVITLAMWLVFNASLVKRHGLSALTETPKIFIFRPGDWLWLRFLIPTFHNLQLRRSRTSTAAEQHSIQPSEVTNEKMS